MTEYTPLHSEILPQIITQPLTEERLLDSRIAACVDPVGIFDRHATDAAVVAERQAQLQSMCSDARNILLDHGGQWGFAMEHNNLIACASAAGELVVTARSGIRYRTTVYSFMTEEGADSFMVAHSSYDTAKAVQFETMSPTQDLIALNVARLVLDLIE